MYRQGAPISVGNVTIGNVTTNPVPAGLPAPVNGLVTCSLHKKSRAIKFVQPKPVLNAEGTTVGYVYHCTEDSPCIVNGQRGAMPGAADAAAAPNADEAAGGEKDDDEDFDIDGPAKNDGRPPQAFLNKIAHNDGVRTTTTGAANGPVGGLLAATGGAIPKGLFGDSSNDGGAPASPAGAAGAGRFTVGAGNTAGRAPNRYYDMTKSRGDDDYKKVCWSCGMDSHEKPNCPNLLCRNCHDAQEPGYEGRANHRCSHVGLSAFVLLDTDYLDNFMAAEEIAKHNVELAEKREKASPEAAAAATATTPAKKNPLLCFDEAAFVNPSLLTTRCPRCNQLGHMDCPHPLSAHVIRRNVKGGNKNSNKKEADGMQRQLSCCGCASSEHSGYECPSRPRDYWRERVLNAAANSLGMEEVRKIVAIDERVPTSSNFHKNGPPSGGNNNYNNSNSGSYGNDRNGGGRGGGNGPRTEARPFGGPKPSFNAGGGGGRRGRDDSDDGWSDDDRPARRGGRGEYDRSYNRNNSSSGRGGRGGRGGGGRFSDSGSDYSYDSYSDDDNYGGRRQGGGGRGGRGGRGGGGGGGQRHHTPNYNRLDSRDHGRNTPSSYNNGGGNNNYSNNNNSRPVAAYQRPGQAYSYSAPAPPPPQQQYRGNGGGGNSYSQPNAYSRPQVSGNSYSAPYGNAAPQQGGGGPRYTRPPQPPANSQPGRGAYSKRGFEF